MKKSILIFAVFSTFTCLSCNEEQAENIQPTPGDEQQSSQNFLNADGGINGRVLVAALRQGGYIIYFRHATATTGSDQHTDVTDCSTQRNLTFPQARTESEAIGTAFRSLNLPTGTQVLTSEYCRCRQTAELAFGANITLPIRELSGFPFRYDYRIAQDEISRRLREMNQRLETIPMAGQNQIMVAHAYNFNSNSSGDNPYMGAVVLRPLGQGRGYEVAVRIDDYTSWTRWAAEGY